MDFLCSDSNSSGIVVGSSWSEEVLVTSWVRTAGVGSFGADVDQSLWKECQLGFQLVDNAAIDQSGLSFVFDQHGSGRRVSIPSLVP